MSDLIKSKTITLFSTGGKSGIEISTTSTKWGELKKEIEKQGYSLSNTKAVIGKSKVNLEHPEAELPEDNFTLFLLPVKTKSGSLSASEVEALPYSELRKKLSELAASDGDKFKAFFNVGKNYTTKTTADLKSLLVQYTSASGGIKADAPKEAKALSKAKENVADVVKDVVASKGVDRSMKKTSSETTEMPTTDGGKVELAIKLVKSTSANSANKDAAIKTLSSLFAVAKTESINDQLKREAKDLAKGFGDVKDIY